MTNEEMINRFKAQFNEQIDGYPDKDPKCAFGAGMLIIISALRRFDGPSLPLQVAAMHTALRQVGDERGWGVVKAI